MYSVIKIYFCKIFVVFMSYNGMRVNGMNRISDYLSFWRAFPSDSCREYYINDGKMKYSRMWQKIIKEKYGVCICKCFVLKHK